MLKGLMLLGLLIVVVGLLLMAVAEAQRSGVLVPGVNIFRAVTGL